MLGTFEAYCDTVNLKNIRSFLRDTLNKAGVEDYQRDMVILAVDEICANTIVHGNKGNAGSQLEIKVFMENAEIKIEISDEGGFYDYSTYKEPLLADLIKEGRSGGMGLMLVRKIMDRVEFLKEDGRNLCRLGKQLHFVNA